MLYEQVEESGAETEMAAGACKFCGQAAVRKALKEWSQEEINELATETCDCANARIYAAKKREERTNKRPH